MILPYNHLDNPEFVNRRYALKDMAGEIHSLRMDQFGRNHIMFAKDLCYYPYLAKFNGIGAFRIETKDYEADLTEIESSLEENIMPDLTDLNLEDAIFVLENKGIKVKFDGFGKVVNQSIAPGTELKDEKNITLTLR